MPKLFTLPPLVVVKWNSPIWVQKTIFPGLGAIRDLLRLLFRPQLAFYHMSGQGGGGHLTIAYLSHGSESMFRRRLREILFREEPTEELVRRVPLWRCRKYVETLNCDLTFIRANQLLIRAFRTENALILPHPVKQTLDVTGEWEDLVARFHPKLRRHDLRLVRKFGYEYTETKDDAHFDLFFREMYVPSMKLRHQELATLVTYEDARRIFQRGVLILVRRDGRFVAGGLSEIEPTREILHFRYVGVKDADRALLHEGAQGAVYYSIIDWANKRGLQQVDFQGTEPYLKKGILQYKKRWGASLGVQGPDRIWLSINNKTPAVRKFMEENPCIFINQRGDLQALFIVDDPNKVTEQLRSEWEGLCRMPGLKGYTIRTIDEFTCQHP